MKWEMFESMYPFNINYPRHNGVINYSLLTAFEVERKKNDGTRVKIVSKNLYFSVIKVGQETSKMALNATKLKNA